MENAPPVCRTIFLHLAHRPSEPLVIHCTAGKDRTGVLCALILSLCGVTDEIVAQEYQLTEVGFPPAWREQIIQRLSKDPAFKDNPEGVENMCGSK